MANEVHHISKKHITHSGSKYNLKISGISIFKFQNVREINKFESPLIGIFINKKFPVTV